MLVAKQVDAGLEALEEALASGFEQFNKVRTDPNLEALRKSPKYKTLIDSYDEPVLNDNAIKWVPPALVYMRNPHASTLQLPCCLDVTALQKCPKHKLLMDC
jgi:hypothetical protein